MRGIARRTTAIVALLGALAVVGGCTPDDEPTDPPTSTSSSSTEETTEPETTAVETPPEVEAPTPAPEASTDDHIGAIWAARYFLDLYAYMRQTGDTGQFEAMSSPDCEFCASAVSNANAIHDAGGWVEGGELVFDIRLAEATYPTDDDPQYVVRFEVTEDPSVIHRGDGTNEQIDGETLRSAIALAYVDDRFIVMGVNSE